jgi:pyrroline-5-carboxylate reductase
MSWRVGFIGAGKMATALARGLVAAGFTTVEQIVASDVVPATKSQFADETGARVVDSNAEVAAASQILILAVKPQQMSGVLAELKPRVTAQHLVISIAAGIPL